VFPVIRITPTAQLSSQKNDEVVNEFSKEECWWIVGSATGARTKSPIRGTVLKMNVTPFRCCRLDQSIGAVTEI
jgi:hypothetical protein